MQNDWFARKLGNKHVPWWHHLMETFSALLALCAGNSSVTGEFPSQRPVTRCFDVFFDLPLNKQLCEQSWGWCFEMPSCSLWRHNATLLSRLCLQMAFHSYGTSARSSTDTFVTKLEITKLEHWFQTHKRHFITPLHGQKLECLFWVFWKIMTML